MLAMWYFWKPFCDDTFEVIFHVLVKKLFDFPLDFFIVPFNWQPELLKLLAIVAIRPTPDDDSWFFAVFFGLLIQIDHIVAIG